jgi:Rap1a immunity proteins
MRIDKLIVTAAMAALLPWAGARAASEANFTLGSTGDLVALCSAVPDNGIGTAALNFCEGYLQGAVTVEMLNMATFRGPKLFCLPNPPPARSEAMSEFVSWAQAAPDRMAQSPTDGVFGFLRERYPCAAPR